MSALMAPANEDQITSFQVIGVIKNDPQTARGKSVEKWSQS